MTVLDLDRWADDGAPGAEPLLYKLWDDDLKAYRLVSDTERRTFDDGRRRQGFVSQDHLDAFYRYFDHTEECAECQLPGEPVWLEGDASWQPTANRCAYALELLAALDAFHVWRKSA